MLALFAFLTAGIVIVSCSKSNDQDESNNPPPDGGGPGACDTTNRKYAADVVPILKANCYACHGSATNSGSGGIVLENFTTFQNYAKDGTLIGVLSHAAGFTPMPYNLPKLSDCNINIIRSWVNNGAQNN